MKRRLPCKTTSTRIARLSLLLNTPEDAVRGGRTAEMMRTMKKAIASNVDTFFCIEMDLIFFYCSDYYVYKLRRGNEPKSVVTICCQIEDMHIRSLFPSRPLPLRISWSKSWDTLCCKPTEVSPFGKGAYSRLVLDWENTLSVPVLLESIDTTLN